MTSEALLPKQDRSRKTLDTLLTATIKLLDTEGLDACTLPRLAAAAKLSPATVYRRFKDKDALLRAAFLHVLQQPHSADQAILEKSLLRPTLEATAERVIAHLLAQLRSQARLRQALTHFLTQHAGTPFAKQTHTRLQADLKSTAGILLHHTDRIRHPNPQRAALFAILTATAAMEAVFLEPGSVWTTTLPLSDRLFATELTRSLVAYLRRKP